MPGRHINANGSLRQLAWRCTILAHRWIGICVGLVILAWCLSGFVMMYEQYPELERTEQLAALTPIDLGRCCNRQPSAGDANAQVRLFFVENFLDRAILRATTTRGKDIIIDLATGQRMRDWTAEQLQVVGENFATVQDWVAPHDAYQIERDQWTVQGRYERHRPLLKFENSGGYNWYVSSSTAQIVQVTDRSERFWNWLGSIPHWLYPTVLRQHPQTWAQVVIWLSTIGVFLTLTGLAVGVKQFRWRAGRRDSSYKGWIAWHHYAGLFFGLFTLSWVLSGLFSMNPLGAFESRTFRAEEDTLNGVNRSMREVIADVNGIAPFVPAGSVRIESAYWLGEPYFLAYNRSGSAQRISSVGNSPNLNENDIRSATFELGVGHSNVAHLRREDTYYYSLHNDIELPVFRVSNTKNESLYISEVSGRLVATVDKERRNYRWLFDALHRGDFHTIIRARPLWDVLMLILLFGTTVGVATGTWLGIKRATR